MPAVLLLHPSATLSSRQAAHRRIVTLVNALNNLAGRRTSHGQRST